MRLIFEERIKNECFNDYKYHSVAVDRTDLLLASIKYEPSIIYATYNSKPTFQNFAYSLWGFGVLGFWSPS